MHLARSDLDVRVLLTTFSEPLAAALRDKLFRLVHNKPQLAARINVAALDILSERFYRARIGEPKLADQDVLVALLTEAASAETTGDNLRFLLGEWADLVDAWQLADWPAYRDVRRLGRRTTLPERRREALWRVFEAARVGLAERGLMTRAALSGFPHDLSDAH